MLSEVIEIESLNELYGEWSVKTRNKTNFSIFAFLKIKEKIFLNYGLFFLFFSCW